ncbi:hypothetical protein ABIA39_008156 [Nocardia sp. GAS34]|uniref:hypothetical protein n=1 Tax=unclassified Nocardia TaxID=2637762 RepID=UPI003D1D86C7
MMLLPHLAEPHTRFPEQPDRIPQSSLDGPPEPLAATLGYHVGGTTTVAESVTATACTRAGPIVGLTQLLSQA